MPASVSTLEPQALGLNLDSDRRFRLWSTAQLREHFEGVPPDRVIALLEQRLTESESVLRQLQEQHGLSAPSKYFAVTGKAEDNEHASEDERRIELLAEKLNVVLFDVQYIEAMVSWR